MDQPAIGLDSTFLVKIASTAVAARIFGASCGEIICALSNAIVDGHSLNLYRVWPHTGPRKSWAAADAASRGVRLALLSVAGEMGYPTALTAPTWGFHDVLLKGMRLTIPPAMGSEVVENLQFKIAFPAQRHCQSAAECAVILHPEVKHRLNEVERVEIMTHALALRTVNVSGALSNYAARDHCLQYIVAVGLIYGSVTAESYADDFAADVRIDALRSRMVVQEEPRYTSGHHDPRTRSNANAVQVFFNDGSSTRNVAVEYPIGDRRRRNEDLPRLEAKFKTNLACRYETKRQHQIYALLSDQERLEATPINELMDTLAV
jgi:2-methylcitrate dehydratase